MAASTESVLEHDDDDEKCAATERDDRGGDKEFVAFSCFGKDEEIYWADKNPKCEQNQDEECGVEILF